MESAFSIWRTVFDIGKKRKEIEEIEKAVQSPDFWKDQANALRLNKNLAKLREEVQNFENLQKELKDLKELIQISSEEDITGEFKKQVQNFRERLQGEELKIFLSGKYDRGNAILTITAGAGGQDAQDWATMLLRMYERYCERKGWKVIELSHSFGEPGPEGRIGTKQVSLEIQGPFVYGFLRGENGVHRLVRISPFSAKALRHTSFAAVEVMPEINIADEKIEIKPEDIKTEYYRASGPGGQYVNKRETAVRIMHLPSGIVVSCQTQRSQQQNKEKALEMLAAKLYQLKEKEAQAELAKMKGTKAAIEWGSQIRSYVLHPYTLVKDHRTDVETSDAEGVLDGKLDEFVEAEIKLLHR